MRGVAFDSPQWPLDVAYVPLASMAVLFGRNGSGKTTVINALDDEIATLAGEGAHGLRQPDGAEPTSLWFVLLEAAELDALLRGTVRRSAEVRWPLEGWATRAVWRPGDDWADEATRREWCDALAAEEEPSDARAVVLSELCRSDLVAMEMGSEPGTLSVYWCLPPLAELGPEVRAAVDSLGLRKQPGFLEQAVWSRPRDHLALEHAPVIAAPIGETETALLPRTFRLPRQTFDEVRAELQEAILGLLEHTEWGENDAKRALADDPPLPESIRASRRGRKAWIEEDVASASARVNAWAVTACRVLSAVANAVAPAFVTTELHVRVAVGAISEWGDQGASLDLEAETPDQEMVFPVERVAEGFRLWFQLALLEAASVLRLYVDRLQSSLEDAMEAVEMAAEFHDEDEYDEALRAKVPEYQQHARMRDELIAAADSGVSSDSAALKPLLGLRETGYRLYLVDEPEAHLHPRLQAAAADWLASALTVAGAQCLVATHSPYFLRLREDAVFAYLDRHRDPEPREVRRTDVYPLAPERVDAMSVIADDFGFDRGELLVGVSVLLFVEGESDKNLLEALARKRLHHAGILIVPIGGARNAHSKGVVDAELLRYTVARPAIMLDHLAEREWARLQDAEERRAVIGRGGKSASKLELKALAQVIDHAYAVDRPIAPVPIPVHDAFDLLDPDLVREQYPGFPASHTEARAACQRSGEKWKQFYRDAYGIEVEPWLFAEIGERMAQRDIWPDELERVVATLEELGAA